MVSSPSASADDQVGPASAARPRCLLSVDLEEWSDARLAGVPPHSRDALPPSLEAPVGRLLDLLASAGARATFFTLGRVARRHPDLVKRVARRHEIATHGDSHADLRRLDPHRLAWEIAGSRALLQDLTGQEIAGYRAPNWSLAHVLDWALPVLEEEGIGYDSSLVPGRGALFLPGCASAPARPFRLAGGALWEFPPTVLRLPGLAGAPAGGALLRMLPLGWTARTLLRAVRLGDTPHLHTHPWEMQGRPDGCRVGAGRAVLLFAGGRGVRGKLERLLARFQGTAIEQEWRELRAGAGPRASAASRTGAGSGRAARSCAGDGRAAMAPAS